MPTMIPRTAIIRRPLAKRWHIRDGEADHGGLTMCGQILRSRVIGSTTTADRITCTDCLVSAISKGRPN